MSVTAAGPSAQALSALGTSLEATAHNVANVSSEGYRPLRVDLADGPGGQGVQVADVRREQDSLPATAAAPGVPGLSGVDLTREMTGLITTSRAFEANAAMVRAAEETTGHLLNLVA